MRATLFQPSQTATGKRTVGFNGDLVSSAVQACVVSSLWFIGPRKSNASDIRQDFHRFLPNFQRVNADSQNLNSKTEPLFAELVRNRATPLSKPQGYSTSFHSKANPVTCLFSLLQIVACYIDCATPNSSDKI